MGVYFVVNPAVTTQEYIADKHINGFCAVFVENDTLPLAEQHAQLDKSPLPTSARIETAKSVHAYWFLEPGATAEQWKELQKRLIAFFDGDKAIKNPSRIMRIPGFDHTKLVGGVIVKTPVVCIQLEPERRYTIERMLKDFPAVSVASVDANGIPTLSGKVGIIPEEIPEHGDENTPGRNDSVFLQAVKLFKEGYSRSEVQGLIEVFNAERCRPPLDAEELDGILDSAEKYPQREREEEEARMLEQHKGNIEAAEAAANETKQGLGKRGFDMLNSKCILPDFIIHGLARGQVGQIVAKPNAGKTKLLRNLALSLAAGKEYLNLTDGKQSYRVAYFDFEDQEGLAQLDIQRMAQGLDDFERETAAENLLYFVDEEIGGASLSLSNFAHLQSVKAKLDEFDPDFIIVDTLAAAFEYANENDNSEMVQRVAKPLKELAQQFDAAVLIAHHSGKRGENGVTDNSSVYSGRGASSVAGFVRAMYCLDVMNEGNRKWVRLSAPKIKGKHLTELELEFDTTGESRWFKRIDESAPLPNESSEYMSVFNTLKKAINKSPEKRISRAEGLKLVKVSEKTFDKHTGTAVDGGFLIREQEGARKPVWFTLPESLSEPSEPASNVASIAEYKQNALNACEHSSLARIPA